jgi:hypothetical protein
VHAQEICPALFRWTAPHPDWGPDAAAGSADDWDPIVGSVLFELPDILVLIDPLLPTEDRDGFLGWLDDRVAGRPVTILTTVRWHRRDREELAERYSGNSTKAWNRVPPGVEPRPLLGAGETLFWLPGVRALIPGDRILGAGGGELRLCPESWLSSVRVDRAGLAGLLRPLLTLPVERVVTSHGEPVLRSAHTALKRAIAEVDEETAAAGARD